MVRKQGMVAIAVVLVLVCGVSCGTKDAGAAPLNGYQFELNLDKVSFPGSQVGGKVSIVLTGTLVNSKTKTPADLERCLAGAFSIRTNEKKDTVADAITDVVWRGNRFQVCASISPDVYELQWSPGRGSATAMFAVNSPMLIRSVPKYEVGEGKYSLEFSGTIYNEKGNIIKPTAVAGDKWAADLTIHDDQSFTAKITFDKHPNNTFWITVVGNEQFRPTFYASLPPATPEAELRLTAIRPTRDTIGSAWVEVILEGYVIDGAGKELPAEEIAAGYIGISNGPMADMKRLSFTGNQFSVPLSLEMGNDPIKLMYRGPECNAELTLYPEEVFAGQFEPIDPLNQTSGASQATLKGKLLDSAGNVVLPKALVAGAEATGPITVNSDKSFSVPVHFFGHGPYRTFIFETSAGQELLARVRITSSRWGHNALLINDVIRGPLVDGRVQTALHGSIKRTRAAEGELCICKASAGTREKVPDAICGEVSYEKDWFTAPLMLAPGEYELVWLGDLESATAAFEVIAEKLASIELDDEQLAVGKLVGTIMNENGTPLAGKQKLVLKNANAAWETYVNNGVINNALPKRLPAGEYELISIHDEYASETVLVTVERKADPMYVRYTIGQTAYDANGEAKQLAAAPILHQSHTVIPVRGLDAIGVVSGWNANSRTATFTYGNNVVQLVLDSPIAKVNGQEVAMPIAAFSVNGRTMAPFRFVGESLGLDVHWDGNAQEVTLKQR